MADGEYKMASDVTKLDQWLRQGLHHDQLGPIRHKENGRRMAPIRGPLFVAKMLDGPATQNAGDEYGLPLETNFHDFWNFFRTLDEDNGISKFHDTRRWNLMGFLACFSDGKKETPYEWAGVGSHSFSRGDGAIYRRKVPSDSSLGSLSPLESL